MLLAARKVGVECVVAVPDHSAPGETHGDLVDLLEEAGVVVHTFPTLVASRHGLQVGNQPSSDPVGGQTPRRLRRVHVHGAWGPGQISALVAAHLIGKPVVVTAHESLTAFNIDISKSSARRRQKLLVKWLYLRYTTLFLLNSELEAGDSLPASASQRTVHFPMVDAGAPSPSRAPAARETSSRWGSWLESTPRRTLPCYSMRLDANRSALSEMGARRQAAIREELDYALIGRALLECYEAALVLNGSS